MGKRKKGWDKEYQNEAEKNQKWTRDNRLKSC